MIIASCITFFYDFMQAIRSIASSSFWLTWAPLYRLIHRWLFRHFRALYGIVGVCQVAVTFASLFFINYKIPTFWWIIACIMRLRRWKSFGSPRWLMLWWHLSQRLLFLKAWLFFSYRSLALLWIIFCGAIVLFFCLYFFFGNVFDVYEPL